MNKKLYRSSKDKILGGVAAGLAEYFNVDPTLVRVLFVVILFLGGTGILAYIVMWIIVPEEPIVFPNTEPVTGDKSGTENDSAKQQETQFDTNAYFNSLDKKREKRKTLAGLILLFIGLLFLADNFIPRINIGEFWPLILVAAGVGILLNSKNKTYNL